MDDVGVNACTPVQTIEDAKSNLIETLENIIFQKP